MSRLQTEGDGAGAVATTDETITVGVESPDEEYDIDLLYEDAFARRKKSPYISCIFWGPNETGKTFTATTFPGNIDYLDLDGGLDANLKYLEDKDGNPLKKITRWRCISLRDDKEMLENPDKYEGFKVDPMYTLRNFDIAVTKLQNKEGGTVVVDTMTAYNDWLKMLFESRIPLSKNAEGKEYRDQFDWKYVNQKWLWTWEKLKNIKANLVVVAKSKAIYQGRDITDQIEPDLRPNTGFQTSVIAEFKKQKGKKDDKPITIRTASFSKFRGNALGSTYAIDNLTYDKIIEILKEEEQI